MFYIFYGLIFVGVIVSGVLLFLKLKKVFAIISFLPLIVSALTMWNFVKANYFSAPCLPENGCMNETGLWVVISVAFLIIAIFFTIISYIYYNFRRSNTD